MHRRTKPRDAGNGGAAEAPGTSASDVAPGPAQLTVEPTTVPAAKANRRPAAAQASAALPPQADQPRSPRLSRPRHVVRRRSRSPSPARRSAPRLARSAWREFLLIPEPCKIGQTSRSKSPSETTHARSSGAYREEHGHLADGADSDQRSVASGQAAHRSARGDQQPSPPGPRRQGLLHPHHRLRHGAGARRPCLR